MAEELCFDSPRHLGAQVCTSLCVMYIASQGTFVGKNNDCLNTVFLTIAYVPSWYPVFQTSQLQHFCIELHVLSTSVLSLAYEPYTSLEKRKMSPSAKNCTDIYSKALNVNKLYP